jgi:hypothetical protein
MTVFARFSKCSDSSNQYRTAGNFYEYVLHTSLSLGVRWRLRTFAARVRIARSSSSGSAASVAIVAFGVSQIGFSVGGCDEGSKLWLPGEFI